MRVKVASCALLLGAMGLGWVLWRDASPSSSGHSVEAAPTRLGEVPREPSTWKQPVQARGAKQLRGRVVGPWGAVANASVVAIERHGEDVLSDLMCQCDNHCGQTLLECGCAEAAGQLVDLVAARTGESAPLARAMSDAEGHFVLEGLDETELALWADAPGLVGLLESAHAGQVEVEIQAMPGWELTGTVLGPGEKPVGGAAVTAIFARQSRFFDALTDAKGEFRIGPLPEGAMAVVAAAAGLLPDNAKARAGDSSAVRLSLQAPRQLSGVVLKNGEPLVGAAVRIEGQHRIRKMTSDAQGHFSFGQLRPGEYEVEAVTGLLLGRAEATISPDADLKDVTIEVSEGARWRGLVVDVMGRPVANATVLVRDEGARNSDWVETTADEMGRFETKPLKVGRYWVSARAERFLDQKSHLETLERSGSELTLALDAAALLSGYAVDTKGTPVAAFSVSLSNREFYRPETFTDGGFLVEAKPGPTKLAAKSKGFVPLQIDVQAPRDGIKLIFRRGGTVRGVVLDASGAPLSKVGVLLTPLRVYSDDEGVDWSEVASLAQSEVTTDGGFTFDGVTPGEYRVTARPSGKKGLREQRDVRRASAVVELRSTETLDVVLKFEDEGLALSGRVVDEAQRPMKDVLVAAMSPGHVSNSCVTDTEGRFEFAGFQAGPVTLQATDLKTNSETAREVRAGEADIVLVLEQGALVKGRVLDENGKPMSRFKVNERLFQTVDGRFDVSRKAVGPELVFDAPGFAQLGVATPFGNDPVDIGDIRMSKGRKLTGTVRDAVTHLPVADAQVDVGLLAATLNVTQHVLSERNGASRTDARGQYVLQHVDARSDQLVATHPQYATWVGPLSAQQSNVDIELDPGATVEISVLGKNGRPAKNTFGGRLFSQEGEAHSFSVDAQGRAEVSGVAPGLWSATMNSDGRSFRAVNFSISSRERQRIQIVEATDGVDVSIVWAGAKNPWLARLLPENTSEKLLMRAPEIAKASDDQQVFRRVPAGTYTLLIVRSTKAAYVMQVRRGVTIGAQAGQQLVLDESGEWRAVTELP
ncbi:MAG: carboxypeptidase-like regulatory domain-containing protein [Myxococcaceae bacterium]|nr:carboxypeptidase-like regulatory domain-containing protein [Myxococcaceae bacterium]